MAKARTPAALYAAIFNGDPMRTSLLSLILASTALSLGACGTSPLTKSNELGQTAEALASAQFNGWTEVPGNGTTATADNAVVYRDKVYLFATGINDHAHYMNVMNGASWSGWSAVPGGGTTLLSDSAVVYGDKLYLFGIGIGDHGHYVNVFDGTNWAGWTAVPGSGTTAQPDSAISYGGKIYLFGIGINDHAHYVNTFDGTKWSGWGALAGGGTTLLADATAVYQNKLYVFGIGINDHAYYVNVLDGTNWSGWRGVPGSGTTVKSATAAVHNGQLVLFGIGINDGGHYENAFDGTSWTGWTAVAGGATTNVADSAVEYRGGLYLFGVGKSDGRHYVNVSPGTPPVTVPADPTSPPFNEVWAAATHNSYWVNRLSGEADASGTEERLVDQMLFDRTRAFEIDIHRDFGNDGKFTVYHTSNIQNSFCENLDECLKQFQIAHYANPDHDPVVIILEYKDITDRVFDGNHTIANLDSTIEQYLGTSLFRPRDFLDYCQTRTGANTDATMRACAKTAGWPSLAQLRGKFMVATIGNWHNGFFPNSRDALDWVDYATAPDGMRARSAFPLESTWDSPKLAGQFGVDDKLVSQAREASVFAQVQTSPGGQRVQCAKTDLACLHANYQDLAPQGIITRVGVDFANQCDAGTCDTSAFGLRIQKDSITAGFNLVQTDDPWFVLDNPGPARPYRLLPSYEATTSYGPLVEKGNRVAFLQKSNGARGSLDIRAQAATATFETLVSVTRPATHDFLPNPRKARGKGCLVAFGDDRAQDAFRICRTTVDSENGDITLETIDKGVASSEDHRTEDRDAGAYGELLRLDVNGACATAYSAGHITGSTPAWTQVGAPHCFATTLAHQTLEAENGDVLFVGTKRTWTSDGSRTVPPDLGAAQSGDYSIFDPADPSAVAIYSAPVPTLPKATYSRGPGKAPDTCGANEELDTGLCYTKCNAGFHGVGPVCWGTCADGFTDDGGTCRKDVVIVTKPSYGRGVGTAETQQSCGTNSEMDAGLCYTKCNAGFHGVGPVCWGTCPAGYTDDGATCRRDAHIISSNTTKCPWYDACGVALAKGCSICPPGYSNDGCTCRQDVSITSKPSYGRGVGTAPPLGCNPGQDLDAGLCYNTCNAGYHGVGPVCWGTCPAGFTDDGGTCRKDAVIVAKASYGRGVGAVPQCNAFQDEAAGLCYAKCDDDFVEGSTILQCKETCPASYDDGGDVCTLH